MTPCDKSTNDTVHQAAGTAAMVFDRYQAVFDGNVALYETFVRIFTVPHALTDAETKAIAESRITLSRLSADFGQLSDLLKDAAQLSFAATIVDAPGDSQHTALDMTASEREAFRKDLHQAFGDLAQQKTVAGVEQAALILMVGFEQPWRLAR